MSESNTAAERWAAQLAEWAIPEEILAQAPVSPWTHATANFAVDATLDRSVLSAEVARTVLPQSGGSVLDVGCGGGRAAMSLVPPAAHVIGVDQDARMLAQFMTAAADLGVRASTIMGGWPEVAEEAPIADVVVCHHVAYNVADILPFVDALTAHARLAVVMVLPTVHPQSAMNAAWKHFWELDRPTAPTSDDFGAVLREHGVDVERWEMPRPPLAEATADPATRVPTLRRRVCLDDRWSDAELEAYLDANEPQWATVHSVFRWPGEPTTGG